MSLDPNVTHALDQFGGFANQFAGIVAGYFKALLANGFTRSEALVLTVKWQTTVWEVTAPGRSPKKEDT